MSMVASFIVMYTKVMPIRVCGARMHHNERHLYEPIPGHVSQMNLYCWGGGGGGRGYLDI